MKEKKNEQKMDSCELFVMCGQRWCGSAGTA